MQSRSTLNVILFLVILVLTLNLYLVKNNTTTTKSALTNLAPGDINHISIQHNKRVTTLKKDNEIWRMIKPINISADSFRVNSILKLLKASNHGQYATDDVDLNKYGLDKPVTSIKFNDMKVSFGITNPVNHYRYIKINEKIYLVDDNYYPLISSQIGTLVARRLLPKESKINKLILPGHILEHDKNDLWTSSPNISADAIIETINSWKNDQAFGVHNYKKRKSLGDIEVYLSNQGAPIIFKITDTDPWLVIARPKLDIEYHFNAEFYDKLINPGAEKDSSEIQHENDRQETLVVQPEEFFNPAR